MKNVLVTGGAGFIGSHVVRGLLKRKYKVICLDNFDDFYDKRQKLCNISDFIEDNGFVMIENDITEDSTFVKLSEYKIDIIIHLAAKAGVRQSINNPCATHHVNCLGTIKILEFARSRGIKKIIYASSSSTYGINPNIPWEESFALKPISPYAASKIASENYCYAYSCLYDIQIIVLRFFTVYGPGQRPDLAIHKFVKLMLANLAIEVFGNGETKRDYTYIDDITEGILAAVNYSRTKYEIINLGNNYSISLNELIFAIEEVFEKKIKKKYLPEQAGDVPVTFASIDKAKRLLNYQPKFTLKDGLVEFKKWYTEKNGIQNK